ncbi:hypothetical protein BLA29_004645, partial [Euroglyphus maynei]
MANPRPFDDNNKDKLIDHPTFIESSDHSAIDPSPIRTNFYELDSNFSIVIDAKKDKNNDNDGDNNKKMIPGNIDQVKESSNISNFDQSKIDPDPANPDDYLIEPGKNVDHFVDLDFKIDQSIVPPDSSSNQPNPEIDMQPNVSHDLPEKPKDFGKNNDGQMDFSFDIPSDITNICDEKFDLLEMTYSNCSQMSENMSEALDSSLNTNEIQSDQP